ncbi:MAG: Beta-phosphoglucomutase [Candidatus Anoxychlamydiales bacterium]|nr:Beta-phosphoglucomutase [Candidatus Anoxychlamydiales bacterium]NGX35831.1 Beta-phosphoglucomutase [Candidatus Anoxychlamydiales bacterium]
MRWIKDFELFLFDLDGLLVNTENIHYQAYINMLNRRGFKLDWSFLKFCEVAHFDDQSLKEGVYAIFPDLLEQEPNWEVLRDEKNRIYIDLLRSSKIDLLPGVGKLLLELEKQNIKRCVVTNSSKQMTDMMQAKQKTLKSIPHWITREDYLLSKPNPECYLRAISLYGEKGDRIIGFEDSLRGIKALVRTSAQPVLIASLMNPKADAFISKEVLHFKSFEDIPMKGII